MFHTLVQELLMPTEKPPRRRDRQRQQDEVWGSSATQKQVTRGRLGGSRPTGTPAVGGGLQCLSPG